VHAVDRYARSRTPGDGLVATPVPGLAMVRAAAPTGPLRSVYRPLICMVLQGAKRMIAGTQERVFSAGESLIATVDVPINGSVIKASAHEPYLALAVELDLGLLREMGSEMRAPRSSERAAVDTALFAQDIDASIKDCALRLTKLLDRPEAVPMLQPAIMRELHYWLLTGQHGATLRALALPDSHTSRVAASIAILRSEFRSPIPVRRLADSAAMSITSFHVHFKQLTSMTPVQFQKRLRLVEARRLLAYEGLSATQAAFDVGYESVSQFTREYARMFGAPPRRDTRALLRVGQNSSGSTPMPNQRALAPPEASGRRLQVP
jgi:AraC-like DNA-binding protein